MFVVGSAGFLIEEAHANVLRRARDRQTSAESGTHMPRDLMAEVNDQADRAAKTPDKMLDRMKLAQALHDEFPATPLIDIVDKLNMAWRKRGLSFGISPRPV
ncbi:hypothetical protein C8J38_11031 [Rhizobium sp. PP-WC-2G-219]|nr:hypothetical protein C8J38_11031 [Rhizobium sp. PP-WC-2G-219]